MRRSSWESGDRRVLTAGFVVLTVVIGVVAYQVQTQSYESLFGILTMLALGSVTVPLLRRIARKTGDPLMLKILIGGLALKLVGSMVRFLVIYYVYDAVGDAFAYHDDGQQLLNAWKDGHFSSEAVNLQSGTAGTRNIGYLTGSVYVFSGPSIFAGFLFYAWLGYLGVLLCWNAVCRSVTGVDPRRAAFLFLYFPSLLFWPSSIGKDAVMLLLIGFTANGASLLLSHPARISGVAWFAAGFGGMLLVRPHVALMAVVAMVIAVALSAIAGSGGGHAVSKTARALKVVAVVVLIGAASVASTQVTKSFEVGDAGEGGTENSLQLTLDRTSTGDSSFAPVAVSTPLEVPLAVVSVLFRPFPWEAGGVGELIAAGEALMLLVLCVVSWRRLWAWPRVAWRNAYLLFAMTFCLAFVIGFSYIANFGILARQRVQLLPLFLPVLLVPLAVDAARPGSRRGVDDGSEPTPEPAPDPEAVVSSG